MNKRFVIAATDAGVHIDGALMGAKRFKDILDEATIIEVQDYIKSKDKNDLKKNLEVINQFNAKLYETLLESDLFNVVIGGDHSISIASILASQKKNKDIGVIWVDAHTDYNTFLTTITGNIHGMPLAAVTGYDNKELVKFFDGNFVNPKKVVVIGARSIDELELHNLKKAQVRIITRDEIKKRGLKEVLKEALEIVGLKIHVSFDLDVIDPKDASGVSIKENDGISKEEALFINEYLLKSDKIVSYDLVEYNVLNDIDDKTWNISKDILKIVKKK